MSLFPVLTPSYILAFQFSSWYPTFSKHSIKSTIVRPLSEDFREYLNADGVFVPEGSEDALVFEPSTTILHNDHLSLDLLRARSPTMSMMKIQETTTTMMTR